MMSALMDFSCESRVLKDSPLNSLWKDKSVSLGSLVASPAFWGGDMDFDLAALRRAVHEEFDHD